MGDLEIIDAEVVRVLSDSYAGLIVFLFGVIAHNVSGAIIITSGFDRVGFYWPRKLICRVRSGVLLLNAQIQL